MRETNPESRVPSPESRIPNPESRVPSPESRVPSPESRVPNPESPITNHQSPITNHQSPAPITSANHQRQRRVPYITDSVRESLHGYMAAVLQNLGCAPVLINSVEDHVHLLFDLSRTVSISHAVEEVKKASSKWIKSRGAEFMGFAWQSGYGAFAVSESNVESVRGYITNQRKHHRKKSFQEEYRQLLERHRIVFDEKYVWD